MPTLERLHLALLHWPVTDKLDDRIVTATTNLDVHDLARLAACYGLGGYWIVQPLAAQRKVIARIIRHWTQGAGAQLHRDRPAALAKVRVVADLSEITASLHAPRWVTTTARPARPVESLDIFAARLGHGDRDTVLCLGTGWGLTPEVIAASDAVLPPLNVGTYNHFSVRSAPAIYLDRIWQAAGGASG